MQWQTTVTERGQTSIPVQIRRRYNLKPDTKLLWFDFGKTISIIPIADDPAQALRGVLKQKGLTRLLLEERRRERELQNRKR